MIMEGRVIKYIFYNQQDGYTIALFQPQELNAHVTIKGYHLPLPIKQLARIQCKEVRNKKYNTLQFQVENWQALEPPDFYAIIQYLSSGIIKGLGSVMAQKIVAEFKEETLEIMQNEPDRLKEVPGIGPKLIEAIKEGIPR
jgi:exodeoxyribonuclease V alpha subunit